MDNPDSIIGKNLKRVDARSKVTGQAEYPGDINLPGQLYMKILFAGRPHARITTIDTAKAQAYPGVVAIFTAEDVPTNEYGLIVPDQPVLCGPGSAKPDADIVRCLADQVALVVAESADIAAAACALIEVGYEDLPAVFDPAQARAEGAPQLHADVPGNTLTHYRTRRGDMDAGWAQADVTVESTYTTSWQEHAYLQPEAGLAYIDDADRVTVVVGGQWTHEDRAQIAHALALPEDAVRVVYPAIGGAFGGREDMSIQIVLALAAWKLKRPVKIVWSRAESIRGHHKRHPVTIHAKWGATRAGKVVAVEVEVMADAGAYAYTSTKVLGNAHLMCVGPYAFENAKIDAYAVYTNNLPGGAFRGFGGPQGAFAAEGQMNKLAARLDMDPVTLRLKNILREGTPTITGTPLPEGVSLPHVVAECARASYWTEADEDAVMHWAEQTITPPADPVHRRGRGIACAFKNLGFSFGAPEECRATIEIHGDADIETVLLFHAAAEVGQGSHTVMTQMVAAAVGVPTDKVRLVVSDTAKTESSGSVSASRMTFMSGNAIQGAAQLALLAWHKGERPAVGRYRYVPPKTTSYDPQTGACNPNFAYGYVAQAVEVDIDIETGLIDIVQVVSVNDVGQAINPQQVRGQIEGAVVQAQGYALMEDFKMHEGRVLTDQLSTYLIPTVMDIPGDVKSVILEFPDPRGPWGARGMGEMPFLPFAPAVVAALYKATGVWFDAIPLTPARVVEKLRAAGLGG